MTQPPPAQIGDSLTSIDTPALVLDLDAFEHNVVAMAARVHATGLALRPHAKSHKCPEVARRQVDAGAVGVCCQKVSEAEAMVRGGIEDVLVTNEIVGRAKLERLARLDVLVEIEVGAGRCGVAPGEPALALARRIAASLSLRFAGLHAYHGPAQHLRSIEERHAAIARAAARVKTTRELIEASGLACPTVTGAGTGTFLHEAASGVWTELQPGSYVFMDADYARNEVDSRWPRFEHSLFVLATVMSRPSAGRAVVDAGLKASSVDSGMPLAWRREGIEYVKASDEHGVLRIAADAQAPALGEKLLLVPGHCDPTVNLYDWFVCVRKGRVEELWPITGRGALW